MKIYYHINESGHMKVSSEELLRKAVGMYNKENNLGYSDLEINKGEILKNEKGKPYFKSVFIHYSISHSRNLWICAVGENQVGIDIQNIKSAKTIEVAKRFFADQESEYVEQNGDESFFEIWTRKEAFVKYMGQGISYGFDKFSVVENREIVNEMKKPVDCIFEKVETLNDYVGYVCINKKEKIWKEII